MTIDDFHAQFPIRRVLPPACWCGAENRAADDHICGECTEHCELRAHREGRDSPRDVELRRRYAEQHPAAAVELVERRSA